MTQATDTDIRELKTAVEAIGRGTEANTRAIEGLSQTSSAIERRLEALTFTTEANTKAIADLTSSFGGLREEMRVGFADMKGQINTLDAKFDERSKGMVELTPPMNRGDSCDSHKGFT